MGSRYFKPVVIQEDRPFYNKQKNIYEDGYKIHIPVEMTVLEQKRLLKELKVGLIDCNIISHIPFINNIDDAVRLVLLDKDGIEQPEGSSPYQPPINERDITLVEKYDIKKVAYLYANLDEFGPSMYTKCTTKESLNIELTKLKMFLEHIIHHKGVINVTYDTHKEGRLYGAPYTIQCISGIVRNFLLEDEGLVDVDVVNSIGCVLLAICNNHNIKCKTLTKYYNERQTIIDEYYDGDKEICKNFINESFFKNYNWIKPNNDFEKKMVKDIKKIHDYVFTHDDFIKYRENAIKTCKRDDTDNIKGRTLNYLYTDVECAI